ncbi:MAG: hypothetical protein K1060chlam4_00038 [Candidatus Anoxychlamydiales bacterium]|nr:hypothetical protein [Candidatus Anoxychlamydiales bacterium]
MDTSSLKITPKILNIISEIDEFKGAFKGLQRISFDRLKALKRIATIESVGASTRIEGAKLSDREVEIVFSQLNKESFRSRDEEEVAGYAFACQEIFDNFKNIPFSENSIKQMHSWLLKYVKKDQHHLGKYKNTPNKIEAFSETGKSLGILMETTSPFETPIQMEKLIIWTRKELKQKLLHPLLVIAIFNVVFLHIHPFQDGNGRLSRLLISFLLLQQGYDYIPYSSLENIVEHSKESYYISLRETQKTLKSKNINFEPWIDFFLTCLLKQKKLLEERLIHEKLLHKNLPSLSLQIVKLIKEHGKLSLKDLEILTKANVNTLKKHLQNLVRKNYLSLNGKGRATWYSLP